MSKIKMKDTIFNNYPIVEGAGLLGDIVNKRWSEQFVNENFPQYPPFNEMALDVLIEDYNQRHAEGEQSPSSAKQEQQSPPKKEEG
jgi:hypothetical protein